MASRFRCVVGLALLLSALAIPLQATAQDFPAKTINSRELVHRAMRIRYPNTFTTRPLMTHGKPLVFSIRSEEHGSGLYTLSASPLDLEDVSDVLARFCGETCLISNAGLMFFHPETDEELSICEVAEKCGVECRTVANERAPIGEVGAIRGRDFDRFVEFVGGSHFSFDMIDVPLPMDSDELRDVYWTLRGEYLKRTDEFIGHGSNLQVDHSDGEHLSVDSKDYEPLKAVFEKSLRMFFGARVLAKRGKVLSMYEPPQELVDELFPPGASIALSAEKSEFKGDVLRVPYSTAKYDPYGEKVFDINGVIEYDFEVEAVLEKGQWSHRPR
jgi:hypothetical protein